MKKNTVTQEMIDSLIDTAIIDYRKLGSKTTLVMVELSSGFVITESSSCVDPNNFDMQIGYDICINKIKDKLWELEGYYLQRRLRLKEHPEV